MSKNKHHVGVHGFKKKPDVQIGTNGDDADLVGGDGRDIILGRGGDDFLDGGAGWDIVLAGRGDDLANYVLSENQGARDYYDGGRGFDTLQLTLTSAELQLPAVQADIAAFQAFLDGAGHGHGHSFHFDAFGLTVRNFEALEIETPPVAQNDSFEAVAGESLDGNVLANDFDLEGDPLAARLVQDASHGELLLNADGSFSYTPNADFAGEDSFTYLVSDGQLESGVATVSVTVTSANEAPVAADDEIGGSGGPVRVAVVGGNDSTYLDAVAQLNDSTAFNIDAHQIPVARYTTAADWATELAAYDVVVIGGNGQTDDFGNLSLFPALRSFLIEGGGVVSTGWFARALAGLSPSAQADADFVTPISTAGYGFVAAGSTVTVNESSHPIANGISSYVTPELHETAIALDAGLSPLATASNGAAAIAYDVAGNGLTAYLGGIYMAAPIFMPDQTRSGDLDKLFEQAVVWAAGPDTATDEDTPLTIAPSLLLGNDTDADGDSLALFAVHSSTLGASVLIDGSGKIVYDPTSAPALQALTPGAFATDYFDYEISDGNGGFDTGTVGITVSGLADPVASSFGDGGSSLISGSIDADILL